MCSETFYLQREVTKLHTLRSCPYLLSEWNLPISRDSVIHWLAVIIPCGRSLSLLIISLPLILLLIVSKSSLWSQHLLFWSGCCNQFVCLVLPGMKICTEFHKATWLRLVKFMELNISEFWFLNFNYRSYHWQFSENKMISGI